jgi:septal ring-binding cell division protein DamX
LPQEEEIAAPAIVETKVKPAESKKVVKELVDKLDVVKGDAGSVASGMALPEHFDDSAQANDLSANRDSESVTVQTKSVTQAVEEQQVVAVDPIVETQQSGSEDSLPESTSTDADILQTKVNSERQATGTTDELPNSTDLSAGQQLAPETTFEDEIAAELQTSQTVKSSVTETVTAETKEVPVVETNDDELASESDEASVKNTTAQQLANFRFSEAELLGFSTDAKALQLVVFSNENALNSFKQSYPKLQTLTYARTKNGQKQLVVVMAPFNDSTLAKSKISSLPAAFQNAFVKSIAEIHSEISAN